MKAFVYSLALLFLVACSGSRQNRLDEIKKKENIMTNSFEKDKIVDKSTAEELRNDYLSFAKDYPDDSLAPKFMHKAAELALSIDMPLEAVNTINDLIEKYPDYAYLPDAMFFKGFILENHLKDLPAAEKAYNDFLQKFPKHKLAADVSTSLKNLGKSPEELVKEFMARTQSADSLALDSLK